MKIKNGSPATGSDYFPRLKIVRRLKRALDRDQVSFLGPRRTGKTSILLELNRKPPGKFAPILINLEKHNTVAAWLEAMFGALRKELDETEQKPNWKAASKFRKAFGEFCERVEEVNIGGTGFKVSKAGADQWRPIADDFLKVLVESEEPLLIMLDEFPWFLSFVAKHTSAAEVEAVLQWFRSARQELADKPARFLVTGSIGLGGVVRKLGLAPSINDFDVVEIEALSDDEADDLLQRLGEDNGVALTSEDRTEILKLLGANWPVLLQLFVSEIQNAEDAEDRKSLKHIYDTRLVGGSRNLYCEGMFDRLKDVFTPSELRLAREVLKALCRNGTGLGRDAFERIHEKLAAEPELRGDELDYVLDTLRHDGYLMQELEGEQQTRFASNILRDYWRRKTS